MSLQPFGHVARGLQVVASQHGCTVKPGDGFREATAGLPKIPTQDKGNPRATQGLPKGPTGLQPQRNTRATPEQRALHRLTSTGDLGVGSRGRDGCGGNVQRYSIVHAAQDSGHTVEDKVHDLVACNERQFGKDARRTVWFVGLRADIKPALDQLHPAAVMAHLLMLHRCQPYRRPGHIRTALTVLGYLGPWNVAEVQRVGILAMCRLRPVGATDRQPQDRRCSPCTWR